MSIGARVRAAFGPYEPLVSDLWRAMFVDVGQWTAVVSDWCPSPGRILEVGCGEGYSTARLVETFPGVAIDAIDIADNIGRLYDGPKSAANFRLTYVEDIVSQSLDAYDLVVLSDVLHHVPPQKRESLLRSIHSVLKKGGTFAVKDWHRNPFKPIHWITYGSDRFLTGDRVSYLKRGEARKLVESIFGEGSIAVETSIRPWNNNYAFRVVRS